jgi:hypothetical protein
MGGRYSLAPDKHEPHRGADDNASGTAVLLDVARTLARGAKPRRDVVFVAFSGEELGTLGSSHFVKSPPEGVSIKGAMAMINMDMVGRMRDNKLDVIGTDTASEWSELVQPACDEAHVNCKLGGGGFGPSDHTAFYAAGVPVLHLFTGTHSDYHKPSDEASRVNAAGAGQVSLIVAKATRNAADHAAALTYKNAPAPAPHGDARSFHASLGTIPDYAGPGEGKKGVLLSGVRPGSAAEKGGLRRGDVLVGLGKTEIGSVEDLMFVLQSSKPGETVGARVLREGKEVKLEVTFEEGKGR